MTPPTTRHRQHLARLLEAARWRLAQLLPANYRRPQDYRAQLTYRQRQVRQLEKLLKRDQEGEETTQ